MKKIINDNRTGQILKYFRKIPVITVSTLAAKLEVSERTIRNDIKQLNHDLHGCAVIEGKKGEYSLHIYAAETFRAIYGRLTDESTFLSGPQSRMDYIFAKLIHSEEPVLTDEIAYEMNVGRSTLIGDLRKLRENLEPFQLEIVGKVGQGLILHGQEVAIRQYIMENNYQQIYRDYPMDQEIVEAITEIFNAYALQKSTRRNFEQFVTLMLDRFLTGHFIGKLEASYYKLVNKDEFEIADVLIDRIADILQVDFPIEEKIFVFLPIAGMRTPTDIAKMKLVKLDENIQKTLEKIIARIHQEMNINLYGNEFTKEFLYHIMFMLNRLRYGIRLTNPMLDDLRLKYPLAYQMAGIAGEIIQQEYNVQVTEAERGYLAAYFGVFLTENAEQGRKFRVALVCAEGKITARLVAVQLKRILDSASQLDIFYQESVSGDELEEYDVVVSTVKLSVPCTRPLIQINEIFDEEELRQKMAKARYWDRTDTPVLDSNQFLMTGMLEENRVFILEADSYEEAVTGMVDSLVAKGWLDEGFGSRLLEREQKGAMVFGKSVAIPHTVQYATDKLLFAVGVSTRPLSYHGNNVQVIFLLGVPENIEDDDSILVRVYDEIITVAKDEEMMKQLVKARNYQALLSVLYK